MKDSQKKFLIEAMFSDNELKEVNRPLLTLSELGFELNRLESEILKTTYILVSSPAVVSPDLDRSNWLDSIEKLNREFPNWTLATAGGEISSIIGGTGSNIVDYLSGPTHKFQTTDETFIAEVVYLERSLFRVQPRKSDLPNKNVESTPSSHGEIIFGLQNLKQGSLVISPFLAAWCPNKSALRSKVTKISDSSLEKPEHSSLEISKTPVKLAIVTRTRWDRQDQIQRNISAIRASPLASNLDLEIEHIVVSDFEPKAMNLPNDVKFKFARGVEVEDSRFVLIDFAVNNVSADFYWFIDDDDFAQPDAIALIGESIYSRTNHGLILIGSQQIIEFTMFGRIHLSARGHVYEPKNYISSFSETNQIPFCSVVFPRQSLKSINSNGALEKLTHLEDHYLLLKALSETRHAPLLINRPLVRISTRRLSQSERSIRRQTRAKSHANLVWLWATSRELTNQGFLAASFEVGKKAGAAKILFQALVSLANPRTWIILWGNGIFAEIFESNSPLALIRNWLSRLRSR